MSGGLLLAAQAQAFFLIDDFGSRSIPVGNDPITGQSWSYRARNTTVEATDPSAASHLPRRTRGNNVIMTGPKQVGQNPNDWDRNIGSTLTKGSQVEIQVCSNDQVAHILAKAGIIPSQGFYYLGWSGTSLDLGAYDRLEFEWNANLAGTTWWLEFTDDQGGLASSELTGGPQALLPATPLAPYWASLALPEFPVIGGGPGYTGIAQIKLWFEDAEEVYADIDNVRLIEAAAGDDRMLPEPATFAMLSLGLAGIGWRARRRRGLGD